MPSMRAMVRCSAVRKLEMVSTVVSPNSAQLPAEGQPGAGELGEQVLPVGLVEVVQLLLDVLHQNPAKQGAKWGLIGVCRHRYDIGVGRCPREGAGVGQVPAEVVVGQEVGELREKGRRDLEGGVWLNESVDVGRRALLQHVDGVVVGLDGLRKQPGVVRGVRAVVGWSGVVGRGWAGVWCVLGVGILLVSACGRRAVAGGQLLGRAMSLDDAASGVSGGETGRAYEWQAV